MDEVLNKEKKKRNRKCKDPYCCIRCGYTTPQKQDMRKHFKNLKKICPATINDIELTEEVKNYILDNRIYRIPKNSIIILPENDYLHYIYLIRCKENVRHNENIYKIGKTVTKELTINLKRLTSYGIGTELIYITQCKNSNMIETNILKEFNKKFTKYELGNEYFIGNYNEMRKIINKIIDEEYETYEEFIKQKNENLLNLKDVPEMIDNFIKLKKE
jgi:hypothetical protein